jgi:hypothetical protein
LQHREVAHREAVVLALLLHHHAQQAPGWHLDQTQPGTFTWTLPNGRQLTTTPGHYPA